MLALAGWTFALASICFAVRTPAEFFALALLAILARVDVRQAARDAGNDAPDQG